ncbi:HVO_A0114 family putative DNA-binding protein [Shumkonia mesophila]
MESFRRIGRLARVLIAKRLELPCHVRRHKVTSVHALAKALGRDYSNGESGLCRSVSIDWLKHAKPDSPHFAAVGLNRRTRP